jgi:hypothetical protein
MCHGDHVTDASPDRFFDTWTEPPSRDCLITRQYPHAVTEQFLPTGQDVVHGAGFGVDIANPRLASQREDSVPQVL